MKVGGKNRYHVHRILMTDGTEYVFEKNKTGATTSSLTEERINGEGPDITPAVNDSISNAGKKSNENESNLF